MPTEPNSSFSLQLPTLQFAIDSTSLGAFKTCPRLYQLTILEGYQPRSESVHLTWGLLMHGAVERYHHYRSAQQQHEDALLYTIHWALKTTWIDSRPWTPDHASKTRFTLIRTIVHYLDQFGQNDPIKTIQLANGKPAVELSFRFDSGYKSNSTNEPILLCGHLDRLGTFDGQPWIIDFKTTSSTINGNWFSKFTPYNQFTIYILAGKIVYHCHANGVVVDGCQVAATFSKFERQMVTRSDYQVNEWYKDLGFWLKQMESCAIKKHWPQNDKACDLYGGCSMRPVCSQRSQESAQLLLDQTYQRRTWDPLQHRGDI